VETQLYCPRDNAALIEETHFGIEVDHCLTCNGRWLDYHQLDELEATTGAAEEERRATITYSERPGELDCPLCGRRMTAFNYRAYNLELDVCPEQHGYWLDAGEEGRVRDIIEKRIRDLARAASAESAWGRFLGGLKGGPPR
jgi:Zn-finger nucleic acid-binding protein